MKTKNIGEIQSIEYDPQTKNMRLIISIEDDNLKKELLHTMELKGLIFINGKHIAVGE